MRGVVVNASVETRWWWIRHAPAINPSGCIYGQQDVPCDATNADAFRAQAKRLPNNAVWIATGLQRTRVTAETLLATRNTEPALAIEPDLMEQHFGDWQGKQYAEVDAYQDMGPRTNTHRFWLAAAHTRPPNGERFVDVIARVSAAVARLTRAHAGRDIVAVAHGGSIRAAVAHALNLAPEGALAFTIDPLSLTRLDHIEGPGEGHGWRVGHINLPPV